MTPDNKLIPARFKIWEEIFSDPAEADRQYLGLLAELRNEYSTNETLRQEKVEINSQTGLPATVFERTLKGGYTTRVERLPGGNVRYEFTHPGVRHIQEVIPEVGNKNHGWNYDQITGLQAQVVAAIAESPDPKEGLNLAIMLSYLRGKPVCVEWEETMLKNSKLPQRVGFKIYPEDVLSAAKEKIKK